jgi:hypothetical protein
VILIDLAALIDLLRAKRSKRASLLLDTIDVNASGGVSPAHALNHTPGSSSHISAEQIARTPLREGAAGRFRTSSLIGTLR